MKKHSRRAFVKRSAAAVASCLLSGGGPVGGLQAAQARRRGAALPQMPVTCYLRRLSAQKVKNPSGQEEVSFLSGNPLSEDEARAARSAGVKILEVHANAVGILPAASEAQHGVWDFAYLEEEVPRVRRLGMTPLVSFCARLMTPSEYHSRETGRCAA